MSMLKDDTTNSTVADTSKTVTAAREAAQPPKATGVKTAPIPVRVGGLFDPLQAKLGKMSNIVLTPSQRAGIIRREQIKQKLAMASIPVMAGMLAEKLNLSK